MPRARFQYPIPVRSVTLTEDGETIVKLDLGLASASLILPAKIVDKDSIKLFLECDTVEEDAGSQ